MAPTYYKVVNAKDVNSFKNKLDNAWRNQPMKYNYEAEYVTSLLTGK